MPAPHANAHPVHITAYFDFMCPWSYLARARIKHAVKRARIPTKITWVPFELYAHNQNHRVEKEKIIGHENVHHVYAQLTPLAEKENILIFPPKYEASSKRALIGFLYAQHEKKEEQYMDEMFAHAFEHTMDISSFAVLRRIALKLNFDVEKFLLFIQDEKNHAQVEEFTRVAKLNGVRGVPTYLINHLPVTGALPVEDFVHLLRSAQHHITPAYLLPKEKTKTRARKASPARIRTKPSRTQTKKTRSNVSSLRKKTIPSRKKHSKKR